MTTRVAILGDVEVERDGMRLPITTPKERALLAALALYPEERVSTPTLLEALWGEHLPPTAERTLGTHVSRLRKLIGADQLEGAIGTGYRLTVPAANVDAGELAELVETARERLATGRPEDALEAADAATALWRAEPLADLADGPLQRAEWARLDSLRAEATELGIRAGLAAGHHQRLVGELRVLVEREPLREDLWGHLMLALYRCGRQADALRTFARLRATLRDELGIEPSPPLSRLELMILHQDPRLDLAPPEPTPDHLPATATSFIGRADEVAATTSLLHQGRLVTLVGPGGVGKTRLALRVARVERERFADGVIWLDLAAVRTSAALSPCLAAAVGAGQAVGLPVDDTVLRTLRGRELLLVLDNCEHLLDDIVDLVARLLEEAPLLSLLATSRERLGLAAEHLVHVPPLPLDTDAIRLLSDRAGAVDHRWSDIPPGVGKAICSRLDGIPLAIELVASRASSLAPAELLDDLTARIGPLHEEHGLPDPRYDSLREAYRWSADLLEPHERELLQRLSVVPGGFGHDLVAALGTGVTDAGGAFHHLVAASLVQQVGHDTATSRFRLLESIREYAAEESSPNTAATARRLHARHFAELAARSSAGLSTEERLTILRWAQREADNLRAAVAWSLEHDNPGDSLVFAPVLGLARHDTGDLEGCRVLLETLLAGSVEADPAPRAAAMNQLAWAYLFLGEGLRAWALLDDAIVLAREADDHVREAAIEACRGHTLLLGLGDHDGAIPHYERAIAGSDHEVSPYEWKLARLGMAQALVLGGRPAGVTRLLDETEMRLRPGVDEHHLAHLCLDRGLLAWCAGNVDSIVEVATRGIRHARAASNTAWEQINLVATGTGHLLAGRRIEAEAALLRSCRLALDDRNRLQLGIALQCLAALEADRAPTVAARLHGAGTTLAPLWPLLERGLRPYLDISREALGAAFEEQVRSGSALDPDDAVAYALAAHA